MRDSVKGDKRSAGGRRERWRAHRETRRAEFVEATIRAIQRHGADVGMEEIAAEAGISKPVVYRHFTDKADLYLAVGQRATEMLLERVVPAIELDGTPNERIRHLIDAYLSAIEDFPELYRFMVSRSFADRPVDHDPVMANKTLIATRLARLLDDYMRALGLDSGGVEPWSFAIVGAVQTAGAWWLERQSMSREALTEYLSRIVWYAIEGVVRAESW